MLFLSSLYNYFFGNTGEIKEIDEMSRDELLDFLKNKKFTKLNVNSPQYYNMITNVNIYKDELLLFEYELYNSLLEKLGEYKTTLTKNPFTKKKFYVNPKFDKDVYEKYNDEINVLKNLNNDNLSFSLNIKNPIHPFNYGNISLQEYDDSFREGQIKMDMLGISKSMLSDLPQLLKQQVINKYNEILQNPLEAKYHNVGKSSLVYKISKKGSLEDAKSFRQVIGIPAIVSQFHRIITLRINNYLVKNNYIDTTIQKGGVSGIKMGMFEQIIKLKNLIKNANNTKKELCLTFIDLSDAFPSTNINKLCLVLEKYNFPANMIKYIKRYYEDFTYFISTKQWSTQNTRWNRGLLQGCPLSPILFVTILNYVLKYLESKYKIECGYDMTTENKLMFMAYMDDIVLVCKNMEKTKEIYEELEKILLEFGLTINKSKTACMTINIENPLDIGLNRVDKYKYLGEWVWSNGSSFNSVRQLLFIIRSKLLWIDKANFPNDQKYQFVTSKLIPIIQRKFSVLYDVNVAEKLKILKLVKSFTTKWGIQEDPEINVEFNMKELLNETNDEILKNIEFEDNCYEIKGDEKIVKMKLSQIKFEYDNIDAEELNLD